MAAPIVSHDTKLSKKLRRLLNENKALKLNEGKTKIYCSLSGHEMPVTESEILSYINGKKYKRLLLNTRYDHSAYDEHIVYSTKKGLAHLLFCKLTLRHINDTPGDVEVHARGRKFQKALAKWQQCQQTGETFKPLTRFRQKGPSSSWDRPQKKGSKGNNSDSDQENAEDDQSDLSDLYPEADFASSDEEETMDDDEAANVEKNVENNVDDESSDSGEMGTSEPSDTNDNSHKLENSCLKIQSQNDKLTSRKRSAVNIVQSSAEGAIPKKKHKKKSKI